MAPNDEKELQMLDRAREALGEAIMPQGCDLLLCEELEETIDRILEDKNRWAVRTLVQYLDKKQAPLPLEMQKLGRVQLVQAARAHVEMVLRDSLTPVPGAASLNVALGRLFDHGSRWAVQLLLEELTQREPELPLGG